jgi:polyhydroxyalkanoate synthesis regulator phasin
MADERRTTIGEGIRTGIGMLTAFKEAIEETLAEAAERGDLSPERAREVVRDAAGLVQSSFGEARERLDLVPRREFDALRSEFLDLRRRVERLEAGIDGERPALEGHSSPTSGGGEVTDGAAEVPVD